MLDHQDGNGRRISGLDHHNQLRVEKRVRKEEEIKKREKGETDVGEDEFSKLSRTEGFRDVGNDREEQGDRAKRVDPRG